MEDNEILQLLKAGDETGVRHLVDKYYTPLCVYSVQITDSLETSEDIVQDFFLRFWEQKKYRSVSGFLKTYLFNSIRNMSVDYLRNSHPYAFTELEECTYIPVEETDEEEVTRRQEQLHACLQLLPPQEYKVLMEIVVNNKKYKEVAAELQISVNTVKKHLSRALKFLRGQELLMALLYSVC